MNTIHSLPYKNAQLNIQFVYVFPKVLAMCWLGEMLFTDILFVCDLKVICFVRWVWMIWMSFVRWKCLLTKMLLLHVIHQICIASLNVICRICIASLIVICRIIIASFECHLSIDCCTYKCHLSDYIWISECHLSD